MIFDKINSIKEIEAEIASLEKSGKITLEQAENWTQVLEQIEQAIYMN